jgi:hypothetical protein
MDEQEHKKARRFSPEEVGELVELAGRLDEHSRDISHDNLKQVAAEMGVSEAALQKAIDAKDQLAAEARNDEESAEKVVDALSGRAKKVREIRSALPGLVIAAFSVVVVDFATSGGFTWSRWPLMGISIAIVAQLVGFIGPNDE